MLQAGHYDAVNDVDDAIGGLDISTDHAELVYCQSLPLNGLELALLQKIRGGETSRHQMIAQYGNQRLLVGQQSIQHSLGQLGGLITAGDIQLVCDELRSCLDEL